MENKNQSKEQAQKVTGRRKFIASATLATIGTFGAAGIISSCSRKPKEKLPVLLNEAPDGRVLRAGLIGCGGRGTGAAVNFLDAGPNLEITALADIFQDKIDNCRAQLKKQKNVEIPEDRCFVGFDSFRKVMESDVDLVLLCTPPHFRPAHIEAAVNAGKHIFLEKPCAVDPVGARSVLVSVEKAKQKGLCMVSGTIYRVSRDYMETRRRVINGEIGDMISANVIRNGGSLWIRSRQPGWTDMEYMLRNWGNFCWLSGDHIVEQFIHQIDVMNWYTGENPVRAIGWGGRQRRITGDQYDFFSIEYVYENGMHTHCAARQISGCSNLTRVHIAGTKGYADATGALYNWEGEEIWKYPRPEKDDPDQTWAVKDPFVQEHINLVTGIRTGNVVNDAEAQVMSTLVAIMGRMSAYTGKDITWDEVINSDMRLGPPSYEFGPVEGIPEVIPVIGIEAKMG